MAHMRVEGICRGEGYGYVALAVEGADPDGLVAQAHTARGEQVPCLVVLRAADGPSDGTRRCHPVLVLPLFSCGLLVELRSTHETLWKGSFPRLGSKLASRVLTMRNPALAGELRGIERRQGAEGERIAVTDIWPAAEGTNAWRVSAWLPTDDAAADVTLELRDGRGASVDATVVTMEDHLVPSTRSPQTCGRLVSFSALVPEGVRHLCLSVSLAGTAHRAFCCLLPYQADGLLKRSRARVGGPAADPRYDAWFAARRAGARTLSAQRAQAASLPQGAPRFSVLAPTAGSDELRASLAAQTYPHWELAHDAASVTGTHVVAVRAGAILEADALWSCFQHLSERPQLGLLTCDEDVVDGGRHVDPILRGVPTYGELLSHDCAGSFVVADRATWELLDAIEREPSPLLGYRLALWAFEAGRAVSHLPRVLCHLRPDAPAASDEEVRVVVAAHLARRGIDATVEPGPCPRTSRIRYALPDPAPHVSIVIPTKDHSELLRTCVTSILKRSTYPSFEIVLVENNSAEPETFACYEQLARDPRVRVVTWTADAAATDGFNFSALVNFGVRHSTGELLVLLNNDTEVITDDWLEEMAGCLMRLEVGVVGAKLLFGDGLVQHVGVAANPNGDCLHPNQNLAADEPGYRCSAAVATDVPMVTGACQMVSRALFDELGGYDERLAVAFNDGDFCLRASEAGRTVVLTPFALLYHREFSSRGREADDVRLKERYLREKAAFMSRHATFLAAGDPTINPYLDRFSPWRELVP